MASGGPQSAQDLHDQAVSISPLKWKTESELRNDTAWNTTPSGSTTPYTLKGHFS